MKKIFLLILICLPVLSHSEFRADIRQNEIKIMPAKTYVFLTHSTSDWDRNRITEPTVLQMLSYAKRNQIPSIAAVHTDAFINQFKEASFYFVSNETVDFVMHSNEGQHRLLFPNAESVFLAGGNLHLCLCESLRDVVSGFSGVQKNRNIFLVEDAIFDRDFAKMPETVEEMKEFVDEYLFPNFPCKLQNSTGFGAIDTSQFNMKFYYHGVLLKESKSGKFALPEISIKFEKWRAIQAELNEIPKKD